MTKTRERNPKAQAAVETAKVEMAETKGTRPSLMAGIEIERASDVAKKALVMGSIRQKLALAADTFRDGNGMTKEATGYADEAATGLYQAISDGLVSKDEVSPVLGDYFGFKPKKGPGGIGEVPGKTPAGEGEAIRKRINRLIAARDFVKGEHIAYFDGCPTDEIQGVLNGVDNGTKSLWTAYEDLAAIVADHKEKANAALDPKKVRAMADALSGKAAVQAFATNPALVEAYVILSKMIALVDEEAAILAAEKLASLPKAESESE